jgi:hypothetical protein
MLLARIIPSRLFKGIAALLRPERIMAAMWMGIVCISHQLLLLCVIVVRAGTHGGRISGLLWWRWTLMRRISSRHTCWVTLRIFVWGGHAVARSAGCDATGVARLHRHLTSLVAVSDRLNVRWWGSRMARRVTSRRNLGDFYRRAVTPTIAWMGSRVRRVDVVSNMKPTVVAGAAAEAARMS